MVFPLNPLTSPLVAYVKYLVKGIDKATETEEVVKIPAKEVIISKKASQYVQYRMEHVN